MGVDGRKGTMSGNPRRFWLTAVVALASLAALGLAGCANKKKDRLTVRPVSSASEEQLARMDAENGDFDRHKNPKYSAETRYAAGQLAESQRALPEAINQYREALKLNPEHLPTLYRMGIVYAQLRQYPEAIGVWKQYVKATRESAVAYSNLGFCYELAGQPDLAEKAYRDGLSRDSANDPCRVNYGLMLARQGRVNEAILQLQSVLPAAEVHYNLASVFESQGRTEQAKREYRKAIQLKPNFADAQARLSALD